MNKSVKERTLVLIKPDGVERLLVGEIIQRFEKAGLRIVGLKIVRATKKQLDRHFPIHDLDWIKNMGRNSLGDLVASGKISEKNATDSVAMNLGKKILKYNYKYLSSGPLVALVLEGGSGAISVVRKMVGHTIPAKAEPGSIRGYYATCSANSDEPCKNLVHASKNEEEAKVEIANFFSEDELM